MNTIVCETKPIEGIKYQDKFRQIWTGKFDERTGKVSIYSDELGWGVWDKGIGLIVHRKNYQLTPSLEGEEK